MKNVALSKEKEKVIQSNKLLIKKNSLKKKVEKYKSLVDSIIPNLD